jgi:hypothetical protein
MKIIHHLGHNNKWNIDSYFQNEIGHELLFSAYSFGEDTFSQNTITSNSYKLENIIPFSALDLQYFGKQSSKDLGKFNTYNFHPSSYIGTEKTDIYGPNKIIQGVKFQEKIGFKKIIIPNFYYENGTNELCEAIKNTNVKLKKKDGFEYYLTLPLSFLNLQNIDNIRNILSVATDKNIQFDGYYIVPEPRLTYKQKLCLDYDYLENLYYTFKLLKKNGFKIIYGYANWDALLFSALVELDYVTIGTYENLRSFKLSRFTDKVSGGNSKGAYFSGKLLNFIKAEELPKFKRKAALDLIKNEHNIFSDIILSDTFLWTSMHKPEIQKNYLLEISNLLTKVSSYPETKDRVKYLYHKIKKAIELYKTIYEKGVYLETESSDYHLETWLTFLADKK